MGRTKTPFERAQYFADRLWFLKHKQNRFELGKVSDKFYPLKLEFLAAEVLKQLIHRKYLVILLTKFQEGTQELSIAFLQSVTLFHRLTCDQIRCTLVTLIKEQRTCINFEQLLTQSNEADKKQKD